MENIENIKITLDNYSRIVVKQKLEIQDLDRKVSLLESTAKVREEIILELKENVKELENIITRGFDGK